MDIFLALISFLCQALAFLIFVRAILSWFPISPRNPLVSILDVITEPILAPLRRIIPRIGMVDITPMVAIIILIAIATVVLRV
ncbi:MAG: YggT family protein [Chloroflexota bacterium]|nr:YggT family protein [Chloroflexota bacterium]